MHCKLSYDDIKTRTATSVRKDVYLDLFLVLGALVDVVSHVKLIKKINQHDSVQLQEPCGE